VICRKLRGGIVSPYSPDLNPIEQAFAKRKQTHRTIPPFTPEAPGQLISLEFWATLTFSNFCRYQINQFTLRHVRSRAAPNGFIFLLVVFERFE
jgi:hypothetical protein